MYAVRVSRRYAGTNDDSSTLAAYLREIAKRPRLSVEPERAIGLRIQRDKFNYQFTRDNLQRAVLSVV